jgi:hypothetical protein
MSRIVGSGYLFGRGHKPEKLLVALNNGNPIKIEWESQQGIDELNI